MGLTLDEVKRAGKLARNFVGAYHDASGMDWEHWRAFPDVTEYGGWFFSDGHDRAGFADIPCDGWLHDEGCGCEFSPRCTFGDREHAGVLDVVDEDRVVLWGGFVTEKKGNLHATIDR